MEWSKGEDPYLMCSNCKMVVKSWYSYCARCGTKLKKVKKE